MTDVTASPGPVVVITGATSGVGRATSRKFARKGASIGLLARGRDGLNATADEVGRLGGKALPLATDVSDPDEVETAATRVEEEMGDIDLWVNNAMTTVFAFFEDCTPEEYRRATEVTYLGTVWGTQAALRRMGPRDRGSIIQVGSALAYRGIPLQSAYCGSKHAINGFTESVRSELLYKGSSVHMGMVNLPAVNTPQFSHCRSEFNRHPMPVPPIYQPEVAAEAIDLVYRRRRRELDVGYPTLLTILANKVASPLLDHYLARTGVDSQLDDRHANAANDEGNLFRPVEGDPGAHGVFDDRSRSASPALWLSEHRGPVLAGFVASVSAWLLTHD